jgi:hypothetical protein
MMGNTGMPPIHNPIFQHSITPLFELDSIAPFNYYTGDPISRIVIPAEAGIQPSSGFLVKPGMTLFTYSAIRRIVTAQPYTERKSKNTEEEVGS